MSEILREQIQALEETATIRENSELLMDSLVNLLAKTIQYCHSNKIPIENEIALVMLLKQSRVLLQNLQRLNHVPKSVEVATLPPNLQHPERTPEDATQPSFW